MNLVMKMSNSQVFGSPMTLTGRKAVSPFGAAIYASSNETDAAGYGRSLLQALRDLFAPVARDRRVRKTVAELSRLDDRTLCDIGLHRSMIVSAAQNLDVGSDRRSCR